MSAADATIRNVSDTALWVAVYRAMETERRDPPFRDPYAARLAGERGRAIVREVPHGSRMAWAIAVRTRLLDEQITRLIEAERADAVLNLAAGLDARPWRMKLPPVLRWYDVDLPHMIGYKRGVIGEERPACSLESRALDLRDADARRRLFAQVGAASRRVVVVTEGLLIYLAPEQVAALARDLSAQPSFRWWLTELASPRMLQAAMRSFGARLEAGNAPFQFALAEGGRFFEPHGWREAEFQSFREESFRLKRTMPFAPLLRLIARFTPAGRSGEWNRFSGLARLERKDG